MFKYKYFALLLGLLGFTLLLPFSFVNAQTPSTLSIEKVVPKPGVILSVEDVTRFPWNAPEGTNSVCFSWKENSNYFSCINQSQGKHLTMTRNDWIDLLSSMEESAATMEPGTITNLLKQDALKLEWHVQVNVSSSSGSSFLESEPWNFTLKLL